MFAIEYTGLFLKDLKRIGKRSKADFETLELFVTRLAQEGVTKLEPKHKAHKLKGKYAQYWECHVKPDLLLIWFEQTAPNIITLIRVGTHADLF